MDQPCENWSDKDKKEITHSSVFLWWPPCRCCKPYKTSGLDGQICVSSGFLDFSCPWLGQFFSARRVCAAQHGSSMGGAVGGLHAAEWSQFNSIIRCWCWWWMMMVMMMVMMMMLLLLLLQWSQSQTYFLFVKIVSSIKSFRGAPRSRSNIFELQVGEWTKLVGFFFNWPPTVSRWPLFSMFWIEKSGSQELKPQFRGFGDGWVPVVGFSLFFFWKLAWTWGCFLKWWDYPPKSSILIGFSIIFTIHVGVPGTPILGNTHMNFWKTIWPNTHARNVVIARYWVSQGAGIRPEDLEERAVFGAPFNVFGWVKNNQDVMCVFFLFFVNWNDSLFVQKYDFSCAFLLMVQKSGCKPVYIVVYIPWFTGF